MITNEDLLAVATLQFGFMSMLLNYAEEAIKEAERCRDGWSNRFIDSCNKIARLLKENDAYKLKEGEKVMAEDKTVTEGVEEKQDKVRKVDIRLHVEYESGRKVEHKYNGYTGLYRAQKRGIIRWYNEHNPEACVKLEPNGHYMLEIKMWKGFDEMDQFVSEEKCVLQEDESE